MEGDVEMTMIGIHIDLEILVVIDQVEEVGSHRGRQEAVVTEVGIEVLGNDRLGHLEAVMEVAVDEALGLPHRRIGWIRSSQRCFRWERPL
jgi:hypothetical protein